MSYRTLTCPPWCTVDHAEQDRKQAADVERVRARTGLIPDWMARWHTVTLATIPNPEAGTHETIEVGLYRDDSMVDPDPNRAVVGTSRADNMSPETALEVAAAIVAAVKVARGESR